MAAHDLVIRNGLIVDGSGKAPFLGDVAIDRGTISIVGTVEGLGREEIDASGKHVTPGFVDIHTHYDAQAIWSDRLNPSSAHGVTTVVIGNCGVGFAPCREGDRDRLINMMEGVEDIPGAVLADGLTWEWESFSDYLDALDARPHDIDIAAYLPHSPLRVYVMGERGSRRERATEADLAHMRALAREAIEAGAIGISSSRATLHRTADGDFVPSYAAALDELVQLGKGMNEAGGGLLQVAPSLPDDPESIGPEEVVLEAARRAEVPATVTFGTMNAGPLRWKRVVELMRRASEDGVTFFGQLFPRPVGMIIGLKHTLHPFNAKPSYLDIAHLPLAERVEAMRDPQRRARILAEESTVHHPVRNFLDMRWTYPLGDIPNYEPAPEMSVAARADRLGLAPLEALYDLMLEDGGTGSFLVAMGNLYEGSLDQVREMFDHDELVVGLGDGGAHYGMICDGSFPTFMLAHWTRDRDHDRLPLERAVRMLSLDTARAVGLCDRGLIAPGYKADLNILDYDRLELPAPAIVSDLPGGGQRLDQKARGYVATIVSGTVIARNDRPTASRPGRVIRGRQPAPPPPGH